MTNERTVAHILPWPGVGGVEIATLRAAAAAAQHGYRSVAFCLPGSAARQLFEDAGIECIEYSPAEPSYSRGVVPYLRASRQIAASMRDHNVDIVHCSDLLAAFYAGLAARFAAIPVICHIRCAYESLTWRDRSFLRWLNGFVFVSEHTRAAFAHRVHPTQSWVLHDSINVSNELASNGSRETLLAELGLDTRHKVVGMIARVAPAKDYRTLACAAARVVAENPNVRFLIVGDHSTQPQYRQFYVEVQDILQEHGVAEYFVFTGHRADVFRILQAIDIAALVTHTEGLPLSILEAMACGKAVVATAVGGIPEIVLHGQTGLLHEHGDHVTLAEAILALLNGPELASRIGFAAQGFVREQFAPDQFGHGLAKIYSAVACSRHDRLKPLWSRE